MKLRDITITLMFFAVLLYIIPCTQANEVQNSDNNVQLSAVQNDFSEYMKSVQDKLRTAWQPPDFMEEGHVKVFFRLNRQGLLMSANIIESSGNDIYDESALEAIKDCAPFGEFPEGTLREFISIKYSFDTILIEEERMNGYYELAKLNTNKNPLMALEYLNMAIDQVGGEEASYFLYKKRADIKMRLGDKSGAQNDYDIYNLYTKRANIKRVHLLKHIAETKESAFIYHYLAYAYEQINDYDSAISAIDKAIKLADADAMLKHYKNNLIRKQQALN